MDILHISTSPAYEREWFKQVKYITDFKMSARRLLYSCNGTGGVEFL